MNNSKTTGLSLFGNNESKQRNNIFNGLGEGELWKQMKKYFLDKQKLRKSKTSRYTLKE